MANTHTHTHTFPTMDCLDRHPSSHRRGRSMARGWLSLLRSGPCTRRRRWCGVLGESSSDRGLVVGLRREPDREGESQRPNGAIRRMNPRTRPDETKDRQARKQASTHTHFCKRTLAQEAANHLWTVSVHPPRSQGQVS